MPSIEARVEQLLRKDLVEAENVSQNFGYEAARQQYIDPDNPNATVLRISDKIPKTDNASPNALEEIKLQLAEIKQSAIDLSTTDAQRKAVNSLYDKTLKALPEKGTRADLFAEEKPGKVYGKVKSADSKDNKAFKKQLKSLTKTLEAFVDTVSLISDVTAKALDEQGHKRRSEKRPTLVHEFKLEEDGTTHFVIYQPAGRLTARQRALKTLQGETDPSISHATTSHQKKGLVQGNSSFVRMITGTKDSTGKITIANDSFSGPGARMPYEDLTGANSEKKMMVKATTFLNQEEIIQSLAQRIYDKHLAGKTDAQIDKMLKVPKAAGVEIDSRDDLINQYFKENPLAETYTQVISPSQAYLTSTDHNREQFEFVRDAIRAFDGAEELKLEIDIGKEKPLEVTAPYKGRHAAFGVNVLRSATFNFIESEQNTRFMNQMMDDTVASLEQFTGTGDKSQKCRALIQAITGDGAAQAITGKITAMTDAKTDYRNAMMEYATAYQKDVNAKKSGDQTVQGTTKSALKTALSEVVKKEAAINSSESQINAHQVALEKARKQIFNKGDSKRALQQFKAEIEPRIREINLQLKTTEIPADGKEILLAEKAELQTVFNRCAYLIDAQTLYYSGDWAKDEHNFELQTLVSCLGTELDHGNTKGCKSNNDRGQRLAQKITGTSLLTATSETGLHSGDYFKKTSEKDSLSQKIDRKLTTIQTLHHTANTGVGGGKFELNKKDGFTDNQLLGKPAKLAKVGKLGTNASLGKRLINSLKSPFKNKYFLVGAAALVAVSMFVPVVPVMLAAVIVPVALSIVAYDLVKNHINDLKIQDNAINTLEAAENEIIKNDRLETGVVVNVIGEHLSHLVDFTIKDSTASHVAAKEWVESVDSYDQRATLLDEPFPRKAPSIIRAETADLGYKSVKTSGSDDEDDDEEESGLTSHP